MMQEKFRIPTRELDVETVDPCGNNLLHFAITQEFCDLVEELVRGEGMNIKGHFQGASITSLQIAVSQTPGKSMLKIMKLLIRCGTNPAAVFKEGNKSYTILERMVEYVSFFLLVDPGSNLMDLPIGNILKFLVEDLGLPVTQNVLRKVERDPELFALCQNASSSPRSMKKLARLAVLKTHKVDKMPDGHIPEELRRFLNFQEGEEE